MKMTPPKINLRGQIFGLLTVKEWSRPIGSAHGKWLCNCACGAEHLAQTRHLRRNQVRSCGCATKTFIGAASRTHGMSKTPVYKVWLSMHDRCIRPASTSFANYGGRGIKVCDRWNFFPNFIADMGERPPGMTIERIDNNGNYEPSNCRWTNYKEQGRNKRTNRLVEHEGQVYCLSELAELLGLNYGFIRRRMDVQGMSFAEAIAKPKRYAVWRRKVACMEEALGLTA